MEDQSQIMKKKDSVVTSLKVGIHEWIVVSSTILKSITLWTDGLVGCAGVAISTPKHAFIAHISSDLTAENWEKTVKGELSEAINSIIDLSEATACLVVSGDNPDLANIVFPSVKEMMKKICGVTRVLGKSGVSAYLGENGPCIQAIGYFQIKGAINSLEAAKLSTYDTMYFETQAFFTGGVKGYHADLGRD